MISNSKRKPLGERLRAGLTEAIRFAKGELSLRTVEVPDPPPQVAAAEVIALRERLGMSQAVFARVLNVSIKTVQSWEQGQRRPSRAALRMLQVFQHRPQVVCEMIGIATRSCRTARTGRCRSSGGMIPPIRANARKSDRATT